MNICIIPARGGSKRIKQKNIREFHGKPIIGWSINEALKSDCFDKVIVSTDDKLISKISADLGAEVPFQRPDYLSDDQTGTIPVIRHCIEWISQKGFNPNIICCLYATAPFVKHTDILNAFEILKKENNKSFIFSATNYNSPIQRAFRINDNGEASMLYPESYDSRSQDLENAFYDAAQFYIGEAKYWLAKDNLFEGSKPYLLPSWRVQDIDTEEDWIRAELLFKVLNMT